MGWVERRVGNCKLGRQLAVVVMHAITQQYGHDASLAAGRHLPQVMWGKLQLSFSRTGSQH